MSYNDSKENESLNGSISNSVSSVTALVWDGSKYALRTISREEEDGDLFLAALGSTIILEATLYVRETTLRVTANGYSVHLNRADVQPFLHDFANVYLRLQSEYAGRGQYPIAGPMEIRVTGVDKTDGLHLSNAKPPCAFSNH